MAKRKIFMKKGEELKDLGVPFSDVFEDHRKISQMRMEHDLTKLAEESKRADIFFKANLLSNQIGAAQEMFAKQYGELGRSSVLAAAEAVATLSPSIMERNAAIAGILADNYRVPTDLLGATSVEALASLGRSTGFLNDYMKSFHRMNQDLIAMNHGALASVAGLLVENSNWKRQIASIQGMALEPSFYASMLGTTKMFQSNVANLLQGIAGTQAGNINEAFQRLLLTPSVEFSRYARRTINRLAVEENDFTSFAYEKGLQFANSQLETSTEVISDHLMHPIDGLNDYQRVNPISTWNLYRLQQAQLKARSTVLAQNDDLDSNEATVAGAIYGLVVECIKKLSYINQNVQLKGLGEVFPATTRIVESATLLTGICPSTLEELATAIDYLYIIFYEGAGAGSLRFKEFGLVKEGEYDSIMSIKMLRSKWLRHDPQHGDGSDIRRSTRLLGETLERLGSQNLPRTKSEFMKLHRNLLVHVDQFMDLLIERIGNLPISTTQ